MRIANRMYLALLPAVLGVFTVAALAYWGQYAHAAPEWLVVIAAAATVASFGVAWTNARHVASRVEQLAATSTAPRLTGVGNPDELAAIETSLQQRLRYAELLALASRDALRRLDEIRLPLHILLENHFGDLNENQEEMLGSARAAAEQAGDAFQRLEEIADLDRGTMVMRRDRVRPADLVAGVLPALVAEGQQRDVHVTSSIAPAMQAILGDRGRLQLALELLTHDALRRTAPPEELRISVDVVGHDVVVTIVHGDGAANPIAAALGQRLVTANGGTVGERADGDGKRTTEIRLARP